MDRNQIENLIGGKLVDNSGESVGKIGMIYLDDQTNEPDWVTVNTGLFGTKETFVPLEGAQADGDTLRVAYTKAQIKDAPRVDADEHLDVDHEQELYRHYGRDYASTGTAGLAGGVGDRDRDRVSDRDRFTDDGQLGDRDRATDRDRLHDQGLSDTDRREVNVNGRDRAGDGVTLHEERLNVGTERREVGTARLRKYVVSEEQQVDVPVTREEVRVVREPADGRTTGGKIGEEEQSVTLHEEVPVVSKETVATENVRLETEQITDHERVSAEVRHEEVDVDGAQDRANATAGRRDTDVVEGKDDRNLMEKAKDKLS